jgi:hypothetical protein
LVWQVITEKWFKTTKIAYPLTQLTRKDYPFIWTEIHTKTFNTLRDKLTSEPVFTIYDPKTPCELLLHTDATKTGITGILIQRDKDNNPKVIAYYSRRLNTHEENYSVSEQELLAVVNSIEHFTFISTGPNSKSSAITRLCNGFSI